MKTDAHIHQRRLSRAAPTTFVGREDELGEFDQLIGAGARLITVCGPPGCGKTRFVRQWVDTHLDAHGFSEAIQRELVEARSTPEVLAEVARALDIPLRSNDGPSVEQLERAFVNRSSTLLVLDNFEQAVEAAPETVARWRQLPDGPTMVVTSREPLRVSGEQVFELPPLPDHQAVELFVERARRASRRFELDSTVRADIEELVAHLDFLPLAIELAAARSRALPPPTLLDRLGSRFELLKSQERGATGKQATLEQAIAWSWELLDAEAQAALAQLSVFRGGATLDAAEAVLEVQERWVVDVLEELAQKSLVRVDAGPTGGEVRFIPYESVRSFAERTLDASDRRAAERRHAEYFLEATDDGGPALEEERANIEAVAQRFADSDSPELYLRAARLLDEIYRRAGPVEAHAALLDAAVRCAEQRDAPEWRADFMRRRGRLRLLRGELGQAESDYRRARDLAEGAGLDRLAAWCAFEHADLARQCGQADTASAALARSLELAESLDERSLMRAALALQACCHVDAVDHPAARQALRRAESLAETEDLRTEARLLRRMAYARYYLEEPTRQQQLNERALDMARRLADPRVEAVCMQSLADSYFASDEFERAVELYREALKTHRRLGHLHHQGILLGNLGAALHRLGQLEEARRSYEESLGIHRRTGATPYRAVVTSALGVLEHEAARLQQAGVRYDEAFELFVELDHQPDIGSSLLYRGWLALEIGDTERAERLLTESRDVFAPHEEEASWQAVAEASLAVADATRGEQRTDAFERARTLLAARPDSTEKQLVDMLQWIAQTLLGQADAPRPDASTDPVLSLHLRVVRRLSHRLPRTANTVPGTPNIAAETVPNMVPGTRENDPKGEDPQLRIFADATGFEVPGEESADLRRRRSLRLILAELARRYRDGAEAALSVYDAFEVGWPDAEIDPGSAADRVYWAIRTLRNLGLEGILITTDDGYALDEHSRIELSDIE